MYLFLFGQTKVNQNELDQTIQIDQTKIYQTQQYYTWQIMTQLARYLTDMNLEWFEKSEKFWCKGFEMSKSSAQLLYGPVLN